MNIIFAGTPDFSVIAFRELLKTEHNIVAVYTQPDRPAGRGQQIAFSPVKQVALDENIPVYQPLNFKDTEDQQVLKELNADIMVVVAYGIILPKVILDAPRYGCLNIHASLLPRWRGAAPIQRAILAGDKTSGVTIMQMDEGLDTGDMLLIKQCGISEQETGTSLHDRLAVIGGQAIVETLSNYQDLYQQKTPQNSDAAIYAKKLSKQEAQINWHESAESIKNQINGFNSWPVAHTVLGKKNIRIWSAHVYNSTDSQDSEKVGEVILEHKSGSSSSPNSAPNQGGIVVKCGQGALCITELQMPGKKRLNSKEFLNSRSLLNQIFDSPGQI